MKLSGLFSLAILQYVVTATFVERTKSLEEIEHREIEDGSREGVVDYSGTQVWRVPRQAVPLIQIIMGEEEIDFWGGNKTTIALMVKPNMLENMKVALDSVSIPYTVMIRNLQRNIEKEMKPLGEESLLAQKMQGHNMTWLKYHRLKDIYEFLHQIVKMHPKYCSIQNVGKSSEGRNMKVLRISNGKAGNKAIWVDGGIHAREWISPATVTYFINQLVENFQNESPEIQGIDWYFMPVLNPDGYEYSHTTDRMWRKNRNGSGSCVGIDLNRNFGYKWGGVGSSSDHCSETYRGPKPFSEPESKSLSDFIESCGANFRAYLTYHSFGQYLAYPWGYDTIYPPDHEDLQKAGDEVAQAIAQTGGSKYKVGSSGIMIYPAAGASDDWAYSKGMKYSYTIELSDTGEHGFVLPPEYILPVAKESLSGLRVFARIVYEE